MKVLGKTDPSPVWVDTKTLKCVFSGTELSAGVETLSAKQHICEHTRGLSPTVARQGKLIPRQMLDGLVRLLRAEQTVQNNVADDSLEPLTSSDIDCELCAEMYKKDLTAKLERLRLIETLCNELDPKGENSKENAGDHDDAFIYALSRKFVSRLRSSFNGMFSFPPYWLGIHSPRFLP